MTLRPLYSCPWPFAGSGKGLLGCGLSGEPVWGGVQGWALGLGIRVLRATGFQGIFGLYRVLESFQVCSSELRGL